MAGAPFEQRAHLALTEAPVIVLPRRADTKASALRMSALLLPNRECHSLETLVGMFAASFPGVCPSLDVQVNLGFYSALYVHPLSASQSVETMTPQLNNVMFFGGWTHFEADSLDSNPSSAPH